MGRVLIACEFSGVVRDAFLARGHHAISCDLEPTERAGNHICGDVLTVLDGDWDLVIAHPPCTFLANSGVKHLYIEGRKENGRDEQRWQNMALAAEFFRAFLSAKAVRVAIENPIQHKHCKLPPSDQIVQPWMFGHGETKATCLWLKNLSPLKLTNIVDGRKPRVHYESPGPNRQKNRSRSFEGIAKAMADQWGALL